MIDLSVIRDLVAIFGVIAGFSYYVLTVRANQRNQKQQLEARRLEMFMRLHQSKYDQKGLENIFMLMNLEWDDIDDYMQKYGGITGHSEVASATASWFDYYDGLGILVKENMIDVDTVYKWACSRILFMWFKFDTVIKMLREPPWGLPDYLQNFEDLANEMIKIRKESGLPIPYTNFIHPTSELYEEYNR